MSETTSNAPITTWREAARILRMSEAKLIRKRKKYGDRTREPWWRNEEAVLTWWEKLAAPLPAPEPARARKGRGPRRVDHETALDLDALRSEYSNS